LATNVQTLTVNEGTGTNSYIPLASSYVNNTNYGYSQFIIPAGDLTNMSNRQITTLTFFTSSSYSNVSWGNTQYKVYLKEVEKTTFSSATFDDWSGLDEVYSGTISVVGNEMVITLDEPYIYEGGNLLIGFYQSVAGTNSSSSWIGVSPSGSNYTTVYCGYSTTVNRSTFLPKTRFTSEPASSCKKPSGLEASSITYNSATLTWTAGDSNQDTWQIVISKNASEDLETATKTSVSTTTYNATSLNENSTYYVWVRAYCGADSQSKWIETTFTTLEQYPTPTAFAATSVTGTSATFEWTNGSTETAWQIAYSTDTNFDPATEGIKVEANANPFTISTGLTAETNYYAYIRANYNGTYSNWSNKVEFKPSDSMDVVVNDGTNTNNYVPLYGSYIDTQGTLGQFIIPAARLNSITNRQITKFVFHSSTATQAYNGAVCGVYLSEVDYTSFSSSTAVDDTGMSKVYTGNIGLVDNQMVIEFDEPFDYNNGNLFVELKIETGSSNYASVPWYGVTTSGDDYTAFYHYSSSNNRVKFLPKMTITSISAPPASNLSFALKGQETISGNSYALNFGEVIASASQTFTVTNNGTGNEDVTITNPNTTDFTVSESSFTLASGASKDFTVTFNFDVNNLGAKSSAITVNSFKINAQATSVADVGIDLSWTSNTFSIPSGYSTSTTGWATYANASAKGGYMAYNANYWYGDASTTTDLISPMVGVTGTNDELIISCYKYGGSSAQPQLAVYVSTDNSNWTLVKEFDVTEIGTDLTQLTVDGISKGNYYVKISQNDIAFDYLFGFHHALECVTATIGSTGYTTYVSDRVLDLANLPESLEAFYVTASDVKESTVGLTKATTAIEAGTGLILKGNAGTYNIYFEETGAELDGNLLVGCLEQTVLPVNADYYVLSKNKETGEAEFQSLASMGATIPAGKAYLNASGAGARLAIVFGDEGNATSIDAIDDASRMSDGAIYNLQGQKVEKAAKGLYIINGKKVVIK